MSITGSVELLNRQLTNKLTPQNIKLMETVLRESERLTGLLGQVLNYTHDEKYRFESVPLNQLLDEVFLMLENHTTCRSTIKLCKEYQRKNIRIDVDQRKIKQVFINIIVNALQAMPHGGELTVDLTTKNGSVIVNFKDTGSGMDEESLRKLFTPFASNRNGGTGIGLAIAQKIVKHHGGKISVTSQEGKGSTFLVTLPAA